MAIRYTRGKQAEYRLAQRWHTRREGNHYRASADLFAGEGRYAVEVKQRSRLPEWLKDALRQAIRNSLPSQVPVLVWHEVGTGWSEAVVCLRLEDFEKVAGLEER